jgi:hypothetical protein
MKSKSLFSTLVFVAVLTAVCGCKKEETAPAPPPPKTSEAAPAGGTDLLNTATTAVTTTACNIVNTASAVVTQAATQVRAATTAGTDLVNAAAAPVTQATTQPAAQAQPSQTMVQTLIDRAKSLVGDQKYSDALNTLSQLSNVKLTPEQQALVDSLKSQIQTALAKAGASDAASALGGVLGGKK